MTDTVPLKKTVYDPLTELMAHYAGQQAERREAAAVQGTVEERLRQRIIDGNRAGLQSDLDEARTRYAPLDIINTILLDGMKVVGELFGSGQMQLPFVLQSAEVMKAAVAHLEQFMDKSASTSKGTLVIATVKGDVHDIGKNLVDIILTNNGYKVVNLGIKCPVETMMHAVREHNADALGMSGLLVKSTLVMKENLEVMNEQRMGLPVVLGGAALTRRYVEQDLQGVYHGPVHYANDAFDGLHFMEKVMQGAIGVTRAPGGSAEEAVELTGSEAKIAMVDEVPASATTAQKTSRVRTDVPIPVPPFWGSRVIDRIELDEVFSFVNDVALIRGQWQVKRGKMTEAQYRALLEGTIGPEYAALKKRINDEGLLQPKVVYGYFRCQSEGDDLIVYGDDGTTEIERFTFPRQGDDRHLCLADFFAPRGRGCMDVVALQLVTMGRVAAEHSARLYAANNYKEYLYFHGLSVESAEALAELWHKRIRRELGIDGNDAPDVRKLFAQGYQGSRYSFGYPACPRLEDQAKLFALLSPERIGVRLTDEYSLDPEQSTNALIVHHPEARYFTVKTTAQR